MTKRHFFIVSPTENEDKEVIVKLMETVSENSSSFEMEIVEGENFICPDACLKVFLSEIATQNLNLKCNFGYYLYRGRCSY